MPSKVANSLGLTLTKTFGRCFSMDNKQVPLIDQIKDAQFTFASLPEKKIKMTVLVDDVLASYGLLLGRNLCRDVGGELNMDMTKARIPVKGVIQKLLPEKESKYTVVKFDDQRAQIIFESSGMGNYFMHADDGLEVAPESEDAIPLNDVPIDCESSVTES